MSELEHGVSAALACKRPAEVPNNGAKVARLDHDQSTFVSTSASASGRSAPSSAAWSDFFHGSVHFFGTRSFFSSTSSSCGKVKIAAFDLDGTLIKTASGRVFPKDKTDWQFFSFNVPRKLAELVDKGFKLVIVTNQNGIPQKLALADFQWKVEQILKKLDSRIADNALVIVATGKNCCRKPSTGAWDEALRVAREDLGEDFSLDKEASFFCGDGAGRPERKGLRKKDFSDSDLKFSLNLGLPFRTPDNFFLGEKDEASIPSVFAFDPRRLGLGSLPQRQKKNRKTSFPALPSEVECGGPDDYEGDVSKSGDDSEIRREGLKKKLFEGFAEGELLLLVGPPGAGKSTLAMEFFGESHEYVNQDTLKTRERCVAAVRAALRAGKAVLVDNQNAHPKTRAEYLSVVEELNKQFLGRKISARAVTMNVPKEMALHLNLCRARLKEKVVPEPVIFAFYRDVKLPVEGEGFSTVISYTQEDFCWLRGVSAEKRRTLTAFV